MMFHFEHELQKIGRIVRVVKYASRTPEQVFQLALVGRFWREALVEYKQLAATVFDRIFDARNEWQSNDDVKQVWLQAAAIMCEDRHFDVDLVAVMASAIRNETRVRVLAEYEAALAAPRERDAEWMKPSFVPHPAAAAHRFTQSLGTTAVAFRDSGRRLDFFRDEARSRDPAAAYDFYDEVNPPEVPKPVAPSARSVCTVAPAASDRHMSKISRNVPAGSPTPREARWLSQR